MACSKKREEIEQIISPSSNTSKLKIDKNDSGVLDTEIECDAECDDDPETIRLTTDACGETFPHRRLSSVSSEDAFSDYSASNTTSSSEESDIGSITNGRSKLRFWTSMITFTISSLLGGVAVSMLVPFYTKEAEDKGVSVSQAGLVIFYLTRQSLIFLVQIIAINAEQKLNIIATFQFSGIRFCKLCPNLVHSTFREILK